MGLLTRVDMAALAAYATAYSHWVEAEKVIQERGLTVAIRDDKGILRALQPLPEVGIECKMLEKVRQFASEFGLTPSSRARIEVPQPAVSKEALRAEIEERIHALESAG